MFQLINYTLNIFSAPCVTQALNRVTLCIPREFL
nr:MAG TPA: hypothetical protein [Ackermannviridae sp.]